jgi:hypothetical protein
MLTRIICAGVALTLSLSATGTSQTPVTLAQAAHQFRYGNINERMQSFYSLDRVAGSWTRPGAAQSLLALVEREDSLLVAVIRESGGRLAAGDKYGEGFAEYDGQLVDRCLKYCDRDALLTHILANIEHVPELRRDAIDLLSNTYASLRYSPEQRARINSAFIRASHDSTSFLTRESGLGAIGVAIRSGLAGAADRARLHQAVVAAASDPNVDVRLAVVRRLSERHDPSDLPLLERLSVSDTAQQVKNGRRTYPVRDAARIALQDTAKRSP